MKTLKQKIKLTGEETITVSELREQPGEVLDQVELGMIFQITRNGIIVATLSKPEPNAFELGAECRRLGYVH